MSGDFMDHVLWLCGDRLARRYWNGRFIILTVIDTNLIFFATLYSSYLVFDRLTLVFSLRQTLQDGLL